MRKLLLTTSVFIAIFSFFACSEEETSDITPLTSSGFTWTDNAGNSVTADSAYYDSRYKTIKAFKGGFTKFVEINLTDGIVGTYTIGTTNAFGYLSGTAQYIASSGSVIITANANSKMSGTFTTAGTGASITTITGAFTDISVK